MSQKTNSQPTQRAPNFSEHALDVNQKRGSFRYADIEPFVDLLVVDEHGYYREYQAKAIRSIMSYLWGGGYENIQDLARENYPVKPAIQRRFRTEGIYLQHLPLPDRLSGVVHMATGTGKSFVIFAVAYLSLVMGFTKRVLVFGPSSTIIEEGLRNKFRWLMSRRDLQDALPSGNRNRPIAVLTDNDVFEEQSVVIENINVIFGERRSAIRDFFKENSDEDVLVLGDEIHHAYSHLEFHGDHFDVDSSSSEERLWMKFLRDNLGIKRHIGFTGTPYNADEHFSDIIFDYSIKDAIEERQIKLPNPTKSITTEGGVHELTDDALFRVVIERHNENARRYSYPNQRGMRRVKPTTIFICSRQATAESSAAAFKLALAQHEQIADIEAEQKVIIVTSNKDESEYLAKLEAIEEVDSTKVGGSVEYVFAVAMLSEGWDVDNVFQIVPMQDKVFNSKLLISQVLGRGLRLPRGVAREELFAFGEQPMVTIANHERFGTVVEELLRAVINTDVHLVSEVLPEQAPGGRGVLHFPLALLESRPVAREEVIQVPTEGQPTPQQLILEPQTDEKVEILYREDTRVYDIPRRMYSLDTVVGEIDRRFRNREFEGSKAATGYQEINLPGETKIRDTIMRALQAAGITGAKVTLDNKRRIDLFFNQQLPAATIRRTFDRVDGDIDFSIRTSNLERRAVRISELENDTSAFISDLFEQELSAENTMLLKYIRDIRSGAHQTDAQIDLLGVDFLQRHSDWIRTLVAGDGRSPFLVKADRLLSPQSIVFTSHDPERRFLFELIEVDGLIASWIKAPDKGFYSIEYEYWHSGKDRVRAGFNPDFFLRIELEKYIAALDHAGQDEHLGSLRKLLSSGVRSLIHIVEIKSDEDEELITLAKEDAAKEYVKRLNAKLAILAADDVPADIREEIMGQRYSFKLLRPSNYFGWRNELQSGSLFLGSVSDGSTSA